MTVIRRLLACLLAALPLAAAAEPLQYLLSYRLTGTPQEQGADWSLYRFQGPVSVLGDTAADAAGQISEWLLYFAAPSRGNSEPVLGSRHFALRLADGSEFSALLAPTGADRILFEAPRQPRKGQALPFRYRADGCLGVEGTAGPARGRQGRLCLSGNFDFADDPLRINDLHRAKPALATSSLTLVLN